MASEKKVRRELDDIRSKIGYWEEKAPLAVQKGRDDLAREALIEKRKCTDRATELELEITEHNALIEEYQSHIRQLQEKLSAARDKQRMLVQRHTHANQKRQAQEEIRRMNGADAMYRFDKLENRIERMEAEADLINYGAKPSLEEELENLGVDEEIEAELKAIKTARAPKDSV